MLNTSTQAITGTRILALPAGGGGGGGNDPSPTCPAQYPGCPGYVPPGQGGSTGTSGSPGTPYCPPPVCRTGTFAPPPPGLHPTTAHYTSAHSGFKGDALECTGRVFWPGACPSERGAAGTTPQQVKQSFLGALAALTSAIPVGDLLDAIGGATGAGAEDAGAASNAVRQPALNAARSCPRPERCRKRGEPASAQPTGQT